MARQLIEQVRSSIEERNHVIKSLYADDSIRKAVIGTLVKLGCSESAARDYFTDAIVSFTKSCYRPEFTIKSTVTNYLIGTAKNIWLKEVTKSKRSSTTMLVEEVSVEPEEEKIISEERKTLLRTLLDQLDETCRQVLLLWAHNQKMKAIALKMAYKSEGMARKKKHQCIQRLYAIVANNKQILNDLY